MEDVRRIGGVGGDKSTGPRAFGEGILKRDCLGKMKFEQTSDKAAFSMVR